MSPERRMVNAIREILGLEPLYGPRSRRSAPRLADHVGSGNRRIGPRWPKHVQITSREDS
jgi:hypothetical protein